MAGAGRKVPRLQLAHFTRLYQFLFLRTLPAALLLTSCAGGSALAAAPEPAKQARFATREEVAQVWTGLTADGRSVVRINLYPDGTGLGGEARIGGELQIFRIPRWSYENGRISISVEPIGPTELEVGTLEGSVIGFTMDVMMKGQGWKRPVWLRREADLEGSWITLKMRMRELQEPP